MALPVPSTVSDPTVVQRVKFMQDGSGFQFLVAEWPTNIPAADPTTTAGDGSLTDPNRYGDDAAATHIMYRIVEGRPTLTVPADTPSIRGAPRDTDELEDLFGLGPATWATQAHRDRVADMETGAMFVMVNPNVWFVDRVYPLTAGVTEVGDTKTHVVMMPNLPAMDATMNCYWVMAWLGVDDNDILVGYDQTP